MKVLIVDDEKPARDRLLRLLTAYPNVEVVAEAADGISALKLIQSLKVDLVFLDIDMPELNGLEVAQTLAGKGPSIIFVTAHSKHALAAFEASALDYVVKPINPSRLTQTIEKINRLGTKQNQEKLLDILLNFPNEAKTPKFAFRIGQHYELVPIEKISAFLALDHYAQVLAGEKEYLSDESLDQLEKRLDSNKFLRIHRSAIINLDYLSEMKRLGDRKYLAILSDHRQTELAISRERLVELRRRLGLD